MPGPAPKPTKLKLLAGNPGKRPLNDAEPEPRAPAEVPRAPRGILDPVGRAEWRRIVPELMALGLYTEVDRAALVIYCNAWARWAKAEAEVRRLGELLESDKGNLYYNPWLGVANKAAEVCHRMAKEFGFTPSARTRIRVEKPAEVDELDQLLGKRAARG